eukprot:TRINITY_DN71238_c0_g1_i1.p1 TRINITY_DN71238_c0_g1~~TRINITY_DN71238_c0_g1_i1.p1  ORF type:complete len:597 (-),score=144.79 TRINITY_DN71238_c0_g1_i1:86-1699(-)
MGGPAMSPQQQNGAGAAPAGQSPLLRIRAGIEAGNAAAVMEGVREAHATGVHIAPNVQEMITQWLAVNAPGASAFPQANGAAGGQPQAAAAPASAPAAVAAAPGAAATPAEPKLSNAGAGENIQAGEGSRNWTTQERTLSDDTPFKPAAKQSEKPKASPDALRTALLRFFEGAPKGSDAAEGLGIREAEDGARYLPLPMLGRAVGLGSLEEDEVIEIVLACIREAPKGVFVLSGYGVGLCEWAGWDEFNSALQLIVAATKDPAFEPRSIQQAVLRAARGAVRSGHVRQAQVLRSLQEQLSPQALPEDAAPALRSAISRRTRLALACVVDAIASQGLGPEAGPDSMGLVGQLPRMLFGHIFDKVDDRDRGACAFLGEVLQSWDKRRCFSKRWIQDAAGKFSIPKGVNSEKEEGRGWYALTAENLHKTVTEAVCTPASEGKQESGSQREAEKSEKRRRSRSPRRSAEEVSKKDGGTAEQQQDRPGEEASAAADAEGKARPANNKKKIVQRDEDDDETVARHLEESRKRRAALMAKYKGD